MPKVKTELAMKGVLFLKVWRALNATFWGLSNFCYAGW